MSLSNGPAIRIRLKRKPKDRKVRPYRIDECEDLYELGRKCRRWADDNRDTLIDHDAVIPEGIGNRAADNWRVLLSVADLCGATTYADGTLLTWGAFAREIAQTRVAVADEQSDDSIAKQILSDIRDKFMSEDIDRIWSAEVETYLNVLELRPWSDWKRNKGGVGITDSRVAGLLKSFEIEPKQIWKTVGAKRTQQRGYYRKQFEDAWLRYLPPWRKSSTLMEEE